MGDHFQHLVDQQATAAEAPSLAGKLLRWLIDEGIVAEEPSDCVLDADLGRRAGPAAGRAVGDLSSVPGDGLWSGGVSVCSEKTVYHCGQGCWEVTCPSCGEVVEHAWGEAVDDWWQGGAGILACAACGHSAFVGDWAWDPRWAFGHLGVTFWNWEPLAPSFLREVEAVLGHPVVLVDGKL